MKEHPQYGTRIPPEELEAMKEVARSTTRDTRSGSYYQRRPMSPGGPPRGQQGGGPYPRSQGPRPQGPRGRRDQQQSHPYPRPGGPGPAPAHPGRERPHRDRGPGKPHRTGVQRAGEGPPRPSPQIEEAPLQRIRSVLGAYQVTGTVLAAHSLGLFSEVHRKPQSLEDLSKHCGVDPRGMSALLESLVGLGILHRHGPTFVLPRDLAPYLVAGADGDGTGMLDMTADLAHAWLDLARGMREGTPRYRLTSEAILAGDPERVRRYIRAVHTGSREAAKRVTELAPLLPGSSLLDVAGGSGIYAAEYARRTPELKAHLFDLPPTLEVARDILHAEGLEDLIEYSPGDYRHDPFPGPVDTILLSNVFQTESEEHSILILRKAHEALRPGGTLLVHGVMSETAGPSNPRVALFSMLMYVLFDHGRAYSAEQISEWLAQERFGVRAIRPLGSPFESKLIIASRLE